jgi:chromosome segregation ATPase
MLIDSNKSMILSKLTPKQCIWNKTNVTLLAADCGGPFKAHGKTQITVAESNMQMTNKLNRLRYELKSKATKLKTLNERCKEDKLKFKKRLKENKSKRKDNIEYLEYKIEEMRLNEEQMIEDLYSQQGLTKDAIRSMESLSDQFESERERIKKDAESQLQSYIEKEEKVWGCKIEALKTVNETLTKRIQRYEDQERNLIDSGRKCEEMEQQIEELNEDLERIRNERRSYKEENHKLMKQVIQVEEAFKTKDIEYEHKLKKINFKMSDFQKMHDTSIIEDKLTDKSNQVESLLEKAKSMEEKTTQIGK